MTSNGATVQISREQVLAYRVEAQGLHRQARRADDLAVLDIGVQDSGADAARLAFDARLTQPPPDDGIGPGQPLALVWSLRGAPYVHRRRELDALAGALWPLSGADAVSRLNETGPSVARAGYAGLDQFELGVAAMHDAIRKATPKGEASAAATKALPHELGRDCRACHARHLSDSLMRMSSMAAGLELEPGTAPPVLRPRPKAKRPKKLDVDALQRLVIGYLTVLGPATQGDVAGYLEVRRADLAAHWPGDGLVEVSVDGRAAWAPAEQIDQLAAPPEPDVVRLLGGFDPWLQARDRDLIVPDRAAQKVMWPVLGRPNVLLVDGEVAGIWRPRASGKRLTLKVEAFVPLPEAVWTQVEDEAQRVGVVRHVSDVRVTRTDP